MDDLRVQVQCAARHLQAGGNRAVFFSMQQVRYASGKLSLKCMIVMQFFNDD